MFEIICTEQEAEVINILQASILDLEKKKKDVRFQRLSVYTTDV